MSNDGHRRSSIFSGLLLVLLGVIFLAEHLNPALGIGRLIRTYWPVLLIVWGLAKLIDYFAARRPGEPRAPILSGGEAALLVLLGLILFGFVFRDWIRDHYPDFDINGPFSQSYTHSRQLSPRAIPAGAHVVIETQWGNISVHAGEGNDLVVSGTESAWASNEEKAREQAAQVDIVIEQSGNDYIVHPVRPGGFRGRVGVDLDVQAPKTVSVTAHTAHGDIHATGIAGRIEARTEGGDLDVQDAGSDVTATMGRGDARIVRVGGSVRLTGRGTGHVEIADVMGDVTSEGLFVGSGVVRNVKGTTRCSAPPWVDLSVGQLNGSLEFPDAGLIRLSGAGGPVRISTRNKQIDVEKAAGRLDITGAYGPIRVVYSSPPSEDVNISNNAGEVELTLPATSSFSVSAVSRSGEVKSDFEEASRPPGDWEFRGRLSGQVGGKPGALGPRITIATSYGTIHLRKAQ